MSGESMKREKSVFLGATGEARLCCSRCEISSRLSISELGETVGEIFGLSQAQASLLLSTNLKVLYIRYKLETRCEKLIKDGLLVTKRSKELV